MLMEVSAACETFNCLPKPGGLFDQDPDLVRRILLVRGLQAEKRNADMPKPTKAK